MKFTRLALALIAIGFSGIAQALPVTAQFALSSPPSSTAGSTWTSSEAWAGTEAGGTLVRTDSPPPTNFATGGFGDAVSSVSNGFEAIGRVTATSLNASLDFTGALPGETGYAQAWWKSGFMLQPHASITLLGIASFGLGGIKSPAQGSVNPFQCNPRRYPSWSGGCSEAMDSFKMIAPGGQSWGRITLWGGFNPFTEAETVGLDYWNAAIARERAFPMSQETTASFR